MDFNLKIWRQIILMLKDNFKLRAKNVTCFDKDVRLLYTGSGLNALNVYQNDRQLMFQDMNSADWGGMFQTATGEVWVADGKTFPFAFNQVAFCTIKFVYGSTLVTTSRAFLVGQKIETFLQLFMQDLVDDIVTALGIPIATAYKLGGAAPVGIEMYYSGDVLQMNLLGMQDFSGGGSYQSFTIAVHYATTSFALQSYPNSFKLENSIGYNIDIVVEDLTTQDYTQLVNSLLDQSVFVETIRKQSNNKEQIQETILFKKYDMSGTEKTKVNTAVIDPYQYQNTLDEKMEIPIDGQGYLELTILAGESLNITFFYRTSGVTSYEQLAELGSILREQGIASMNEEEELELDKAFLNFSGNLKTNNLTNITLIGIITYLAFKN